MYSTILSLLKYLPIFNLLPNFGAALTTILETVKPFITTALEGTVWFLKHMWEGLVDVADNIYTVMFVLVVCAGVFFYADKRSDDECKVQVTKLERQIAALRKNPVKTVPNSAATIKWPWEYLF